METRPVERAVVKPQGEIVDSEPPAPRERQSDLLQNRRAQLKSGQTQAVYVPKRVQADADLSP